MFFWGKKKKEQAGNLAAGNTPGNNDSVYAYLTDELKKTIKLKFNEVISLTEEEIKSKIQIDDNMIVSALNQFTSGDLQKRFDDFIKGKVKISSLTIPKEIVGKIQSLGQNVNLEKVLPLAGSVAQIATLALLVVTIGYLHAINGKLTKLSQSVTQIADFLETEYVGALQTSINEVRRFTSFQSETIQNTDVRNRELGNLKSIEKDCANKINQANASITKILGSERNYFTSYVNYTEQIEKWFNYQQILLVLLNQISELTFSLNLGAVSRENSHWNYNLASKEVLTIREKIQDWHKANIEHYNVDLEKGYHIKSSTFHDVAKRIPIDSIKNKLVREDIPDSMLKMIAHQTKENDEETNNMSDNPYEKDVKLIIDEGKLFYVPA